MGTVLALSGGVGGAKLAHGLAAVVPHDRLTIVCNTGDDFEHVGLTICPDLDSVTYALAGLDDRDRGWGRAHETWAFLDALASFSDATWFKLGDRDLALHVWRSNELRAGRTLSEVAAELTTRLGITARVLPMSDQPVRTIIHTEVGTLEFQDYFVRHRAEPRVRRIEYSGAERAVPSMPVSLLKDPATRAVVICPSNPWLSIDPILAIADWRQALAAAAPPVIAVSPIVGGRALKGPTAKIMAELELDVSALGVARHYAGLLDGFVIDELDRALAPEIEKLGMRCAIAQTIMHNDADRAALARAALSLADEIAATPGAGRASP